MQDFAAAVALARRLAVGVLLLFLSTPAAGQSVLDQLGVEPTEPGVGEKAEVSAAANLAAVQPGDQVVVAVVLDVVDSYHAQSATPLTDNLLPFRITVADAAAYTGYQPDYADGTIKNYPALAPDTNGDISLYVGRSVHFVPVVLADDLTPGNDVTITGTASYQACDDQLCDPLVEEAWSVTLPVVAAGSPTPPAEMASTLFADYDPTIWSRLETARSAETGFSLLGLSLNLADFGVLGILAAAFVAGIVFNVVPCVLPVLPLKAISFYEVSQHHRGKTLALGLAFGLGVTLVFVVLGLLLFAFRSLTWGEPFANVWFSGTVALVLFVMAAYQFGLLSFNLPAGVYNVTPRHDTLTGNVLFGGLTAVLSTPCTFGLFAALLAWAAQQPAWLAVVAVTTVGLGMASPYVLLSAFPEVARRFPRSGPISDIVKKATGFLVLAVALFFAKAALRPILPAAVAGNAYWWVVFVPIAVACLYLMIQTPRVAGRVGTVAAIVIGLVGLTGSAWAADRLADNPFETFDPAVVAVANDAPVVVKFTADWCLNCKAIEARVFGNGDYVSSLRSDGVRLLKADLTDGDADGWPLLRELNPAQAIPFTAVYLPGRAEPVKLSGIYSAADLDAALGR
jgi:thiol:disulfide interchange protein DsbD